MRRGCCRRPKVQSVSAVHAEERPSPEIKFRHPLIVGCSSDGTRAKGGANSSRVEQVAVAYAVNHAKGQPVPNKTPNLADADVIWLQEKPTAEEEKVVAV